MSSEKKISETNEARRQFLARCGKFAVVTPPMIGLMLSTARSNYALAASGIPGFIQESNNESSGGHNNTSNNKKNGNIIGQLLRALF